MRVHFGVIALTVTLLASAVHAAAGPHQAIVSARQGITIDQGHVGTKRSLRADGKSKINYIEDPTRDEERIQLPPTEELAKIKAKFPQASQSDHFLQKMQFHLWNRDGLKPDDVFDLVKLYETAKTDVYASKYLNAYIAYRQYYNKIHGIPNW